jgi:hypothetical protein
VELTVTKLPINMLASTSIETIALCGLVNEHASHGLRRASLLRPDDIVREGLNRFATNMFLQCFKHSSLTVQKVLHRCFSEVQWWPSHVEIAACIIFPVTHRIFP